MIFHRKIHLHVLYVSEKVAFGWLSQILKDVFIINVFLLIFACHKMEGICLLSQALELLSTDKTFVFIILFSLKRYASL